MWRPTTRNKDDLEQLNPRIRTECNATRNTENGKGRAKERKKKLADRRVSPTNYRPNPIDGPSDIPNCCNHDVESLWSAPPTVVAFAVEANIGNRSAFSNENRSRAGPMEGGIPGVLVEE